MSTSLPTTPDSSGIGGFATPQRRGGRKRIAVFLDDDDPMDDSQSQSIRSPCNGNSASSGILNHHGRLSEASPNVHVPPTVYSNTFGMTTAERQSLAASDAAHYFASMGIASSLHLHHGGEDFDPRRSPEGQELLPPSAEGEGEGEGNAPNDASQAPNTGTGLRANCSSPYKGRLSHSSVRTNASSVHANEDSHPGGAHGHSGMRLPALSTSAINARPLSSLNGSVMGHSGISPTLGGGRIGGALLAPVSLLAQPQSGGAVDRSPSGLSTCSGSVLRSSHGRAMGRRGSPAFLPNDTALRGSILSNRSIRRANRDDSETDATFSEGHFNQSDDDDDDDEGTVDLSSSHSPGRDAGKRSSPLATASGSGAAAVRPLKGGVESIARRVRAVLMEAEDDDL